MRIVYDSDYASTSTAGVPVPMEMTSEDATHTSAERISELITMKLDF